MRLIPYFPAVFILSGLALVAACNSRESVRSQVIQSSPTPQAPANPSDNARRITAAELHDLWQSGKVLVVDTRSEPAYKEGHIKGAILISAGEMASKADELPKDKMIVTYCT